jgi:anti-sigma factor RsiW
MSLPARIAEADLQAYVDGRLALDRRAEVEDWLAGHAEDAARVAAYRRLGERCRAAYASVLDEPVPVSLLGAVQSRRRSVPFGLVAAVAAVLIVGASAAWHIAEPHHWPGSAAAEMVQRAAVAYVVYAADPGHPVEVGPSAKPELLAWLSRRLHMKLEAPDLDPAGLSLIGGRLLPGDTAPAALLMYEGQYGQRVTLYLGPEFRQRRETGLHYANAEHGTRVYYWLDDECGVAVASADLGQKALLRVALLAYAQLEK